MSSCSVAFNKPCPCGGRTAHPYSKRTREHEASKKHQRFSQGQLTSPPMTPTHDVPSASAYQSVSLTGVKE